MYQFSVRRQVVRLFRLVSPRLVRQYIVDLLPLRVTQAKHDLTTIPPTFPPNRIMDGVVDCTGQDPVSVSPGTAVSKPTTCALVHLHNPLRVQARVVCCRVRSGRGRRWISDDAGIPGSKKIAEKRGQTIPTKRKKKKREGFWIIKAPDP